MSYSATGKLISSAATVEKTATFKVKDIVLEISEAGQNGAVYTQKVMFQASNKTADYAEKFNIGDTMTVHFGLRGNEYKGKYYNTLSVWKIEGTPSQQIAQPMPQSQRQYGQQPNSFPPAQDSGLPF